MRRPKLFSRNAQSSVRSLRHWFSFGTLTLTAFALLLLGKAEIAVIDRARTGAIDMLAPILDAMAQPARSFSHVFESIGELLDMHAELERLREENTRLVRWHSIATGLASENLALQQLSRLSVPPEPHAITGRVISNAGGPFVRNVLVNAGRRNGIRPGLSVVASTGFVGVVVDVGEFYARVLLLTDLNSQIPVVVQTTRDPALLSGDNSDRPRLLFLPQDAKVSTGDPVVTSGTGGVLPAGLPVGVITAVSATGVRVKPLVDWKRLEYIRILDYRLDDMIQPPRGSGRDFR